MPVATTGVLPARHWLRNELSPVRGEDRLPHRPIPRHPIFAAPHPLLMSQATTILPKLFKGIALFTPGEDLIYCIDPTKQERWHLNLCTGLQEILELPEPPHFLVPCYTATVDCWLNPRTQQVQIFAEAYPLVLRHQALLNAVFGMRELVWQAAPCSQEFCEPIVLATHRSSFPQLWENHDLIVRFERSTIKPQLGLKPIPAENAYPNLSSKESHLQQPIGTQEGNSLPLEVRLNTALPGGHQQPETLGYVLRLFVAGHSANTERILQTLHHLLEQSLRHPYTLKVIDVFQHPEQAEADQVSATPTLVKVWPQPRRRLVGDLDNATKVLQLLVSSEN